MTDRANKTGCILLCGGRSRRMGRPKADLRFGDQVLLTRVALVLQQVVDELVVVAAAGQTLPELPDGVTVVRDRRDYRGPLEGIAAGMVQLADRVESVYVSGCDVPRLKPEFVRYVLQRLGPDDQAAVPKCERFFYPLAAAYRIDVLATIQRMLAEEVLTANQLFERIATRTISLKELRQVDSDLVSLENINTPEQYQDALDACGFDKAD